MEHVENGAFTVFDGFTAMLPLAGLCISRVVLHLRQVTAY